MLVDAVPFVTVTGDPMSVEPTLNCTVPGADGLTEAFNVTVVPTFCGLAGVVVSVVVVDVSVGTG